MATSGEQQQLTAAASKQEAHKQQHGLYLEDQPVTARLLSSTQRRAADFY
jgi:hypothetical protein